MQPGFHLPFLLWATALLAACGPLPQGESGLDYLTNSNPSCWQPDAERLAAVKERVGNNFVSGYSGNQQTIAEGRLAGIPDPHLDYLKGLNNFSGIRPESYGIPGVAGLTRLSGGRTPGGKQCLAAISVSTSQTAAGFALQHEIGHAVECFARIKAEEIGIDFEAELRAMLNEFKGKSNIRSYAKSQDPEAWAEAYANWYCSEESQDFIHKNLSERTRTFLAAVLEPAVWDKPEVPDVAETDTTGTGNGPAGPAGVPAGPVAPPAPPRTPVIPKTSGEVAINVALSPSGPDGFLITFATNPAIEYVEICRGTVRNCTGTVPVAPDSIFRTTARIQGRNFYGVIPIRNSWLNTSLVLVGYNSARVMTDRRALRIAPVSNRGGIP